MKRKKSLLAVFLLVLLMLLLVLGLSALTRQMENAASSGIAVVTATPIPEED